jgi:hypothetical protein
VSAPIPIMIEAEADEAERPAILAGAQQLAEALAAATGAEWPIHLRFWPPGETVVISAPGAVLVLSLLPEVGRDEPFAETEARWRARLADLVTGSAPVLICTVFRHVAERRSEDGARVIERIRRLNRMAAELSHDFGVSVIDIDRAFAHIGGRTLQTDYRLSGRLAAEVGGHVLAWTLLALGLDDVIPPDVQERARTFEGSLRQINALVSRRLAAG